MAGVGKDAAETLHSFQCFSKNPGSAFVVSCGAQSIPEDRTTVEISSAIFYYSTAFPLSVCSHFLHAYTHTDAHLCAQFP